ncbi:SGNH/GDSL hydrolase family protein [Stigmatella sp. ncwal1]|uniref:SGNH/GDSL hydrolase family protein n=1 Tax=Stigmatella ashevillensis TaxID=2995309 RepID=A0ABT5DBT8_9BACT|nr:SGNH/GDSL hydrolase family protein [Stigmatella ashevillena]MDC0710976.1 SGNH/GDSL hydrolase family protein [Stigmatella ashevillena]
MASSYPKRLLARTLIPLMLIGCARVILGPPGEPPQRQHIEADHPLIRYTGRFDFTAPKAPAFDWPGVSIEAAFEGTSCAVHLVDGNNNYNVSVDGKPSSVLRTSERDIYVLAQGLAEGRHTVRLTRRTESGFGPGTFHGFLLDPGRALVELPPRRERRLLFIGDSFTAGYGNEGQLGCQFSRGTENVERAYAALVARELGAEVSILAKSGRGVVRNYAEPGPVSAKPMPAYFAQARAEQEQPLWDFRRWAPDAVVINLGTNDFSTVPHPERESFVGGYEALIAAVRRVYPDVPLFCVAGPRMKEPGTELIEAVVARQRSRDGGRTHLALIRDTLEVPRDYGCDMHPNLTGHRKIADQLKPLLSSVLGWEQDGEVPLDDSFPETTLQAE